MKAITQRAYGDPGVLALVDAERPAPGPGDVLVRVRAASVNRGDVHLLHGRPFVTRLAGGLRRPRRPIPGADLAGRVEAVGPGVKGLAAGDDVFGSGPGAFAEYAAVPARALARKPHGLTFEQAAAVPTAGFAALQGLRGVEPGARVLVVGASGGVGTLAVQLAKAAGAEVTGVCSTRNAALVRSTGADHVIDHTRTDYTRGNARYELILDMVGTAALKACARLLAPGGTYVVVGAPGPGRFVAALARSPFVRGRLRPLFSSPDAADLRRCAACWRPAGCCPSSIAGSAWPTCRRRCATSRPAARAEKS